LEAISELNGLELDQKAIHVALESLGLESGSKLQSPLLRGEMAVLLDRTVDPFHYLDVDLYGEFMDTKK
jgi:hypothetical protein